MRSGSTDGSLSNNGPFDGGSNGNDRYTKSGPENTYTATIAQSVLNSIIADGVLEMSFDRGGNVNGISVFSSTLSYTVADVPAPPTMLMLLAALLAFARARLYLRSAHLKARDRRSLATAAWSVNDRRRHGRRAALAADASAPSAARTAHQCWIHAPATTETSRSRAGRTSSVCTVRTGDGGAHGARGKPAITSGMPGDSATNSSLP